MFFWLGGLHKLDENNEAEKRQTKIAYKEQFQDLKFKTLK